VQKATKSKHLTIDVAAVNKIAAAPRVSVAKGSNVLQAVPDTCGMFSSRYDCLSRTPFVC
jgi:hypothetical protein